MSVTVAGKAGLRFSCSLMSMKGCHEMIHNLSLNRIEDQ